MSSAALLEQARQWLSHDPDPETRAELQALIDQGSEELRERFRGPLVFGTAGLRGIIGAGQSRMNRAVVRRATAGLARYLSARVEQAAARGVVIGFDGRRMSEAFAQDAAAVLCAAGFTVHLSDSLCPTPIVAFAVRELGAAAGIMVTASHNPPEYNGYKVYADNGAQIIPPTDRLIAEAIDDCPPADAIDLQPLEQAEHDGALRRFGQALERRYLDAVASLLPSRASSRHLRMVYTPLHGVGHRLMRQAFEEAGFHDVHTVAEQAEPDGSFPTVRFPNPEEEGAMDLALALAREVEADVIVANDPDADRLAVAVRTPEGNYVQLTGNQLGGLLGHHLLTAGSVPTEQRLVVTTIVSSPQLGAMAKELGAQYGETLTGFKWIANRAMELEQQGSGRFCFGFEEALGYTVGTVVRDKDGISAALVLADLAAELGAAERTLLDRLDEIALRFGLYASIQRSLVLPGQDGAARIAASMDKLRKAPPTQLGSYPVTTVVDCLQGHRRIPGKAPERIELPKSNVLIFHLDGGHRVVVRPSGTEPKLKLYFDVREPVPDVGALAAARSGAAARLQALEQVVLELVGAPGPAE